MIVDWIILLDLILFLSRGWSVKVFDFVDTRLAPAEGLLSYVNLTNNIGQRLPNRYCNFTGGICCS